MERRDNDTVRINDLMILTLKANKKSNLHINLNYSGHVDQVEIDIWDSGKLEKIIRCYLDGSEESKKAFFDDAEELLAKIIQKGIADFSLLTNGKENTWVQY